MAELLTKMGKLRHFKTASEEIERLLAELEREA